MRIWIIWRLECLKKKQNLESYKKTSKAMNCSKKIMHYVGKNETFSLPQDTSYEIMPEGSGGETT